MLRSVFCLSRRKEKGWGRPFSCRPNWIRALLHPHLRENRVQVKKIATTLNLFSSSMSSKCLSPTIPV